MLFLFSLIIKAIEPEASEEGISRERAEEGKGAMEMELPGGAERGEVVTSMFVEWRVAGESR